jgi:hypothetical protein
MDILQYVETQLSDNDKNKEKNLKDSKVSFSINLNEVKVLQKFNNKTICKIPIDILEKNNINNLNSIQEQKTNNISNKIDSSIQTQNINSYGSFNKNEEILDTIKRNDIEGFIKTTKKLNCSYIIVDKINYINTIAIDKEDKDIIALETDIQNNKFNLDDNINKAIYKNNKKLMKRILKKLKDINQTDNDGNTILHKVLKYSYSHLKFIKLIIKEYPQVKNIKNNKGETVLSLIKSNQDLLNSIEKKLIDSNHVNTIDNTDSLNNSNDSVFAPPLVNIDDQDKNKNKKQKSAIKKTFNNFKNKFISRNKT